MAKTLYEKTETEIESGLHLSHDFDKIQSEFLRLTREWLAGKLIAGSEKANSHNEVILKLLHELKDGENKQ
jgi:hypothetical protein